MSKELDWCTCKVALGGDVRSVVYRGEFNPVSVPELDVLTSLHGEASITEIEYLKTTESSPADEKNRLVGIYPEAVVSGMFPGRSPNMPMVSGVRPSKDIIVPERKQRPGTKHTAAKPFLPDLDLPADGEEQ